MCKIVGLLKRMWKNIISLANSQIDYYTHTHTYIYIYVNSYKSGSFNTNLLRIAET